MAASTDQVSSKCIDGYGSAIGMPQLCGDWMANQIFWLVVTLVIIFLILSRIALPRIAEVLADRQSTITNYLTASEELKSKAEEAERAYKIRKNAMASIEKVAKDTAKEIVVALGAKADAKTINAAVSSKMKG